MYTLKKLVKNRPPRLPLKRIASSVLGHHYDVSIVICDERLSKRLNETYRNKRDGTNVLSFLLTTHEGEIFLNLPRIQKEAREQGKTVRGHFARLFIHALLHLKGYSHSSKMETEEQKVLRRFGIAS